MTDHTRTDGLADTLMAPPASEVASLASPSTDARAAAAAPRLLERSRPRNERMAANKI